jgi:hypothetical protein
MSADTLVEMFKTKYEEFAADLLDTFPELAEPIGKALELSTEDRVANYRVEVFSMTQGLSSSNVSKTPGTVLPGVTLSFDLWETIGKKSKQAIYEYISILNLSVAFQGGADTEGFTKEWAERVMRDARASMSNIDFEKLSQKFFSSFGTKGESLPPLPEKFLKGILAKLAEDMVKEFKPEDFGLTAEELNACERDPTRAFEILMKASLGNPQVIQSAMARVGKKLQEKVSRGELKPQELVAEAEELIKEFQSHPAFVELMETFRSAFNFSDMDMARATGNDNQGRLTTVRDRLRKKLDAKKAKK